MKRTVVIISLAAIMLLALAVPAFADSSGTVYGKAVLAPYAVVITGPGTDPSAPLTYHGQLGDQVYEDFYSSVTVQNAGTQNAEVKLDLNEAPTAGGDVWNLILGNGPNQAAWNFYSGHGSCYVLPSSDPNYSSFSVLDNDLASGDSDSFGSRFTFPTSTGSSEDHFMSATISVVAPN